MVAAVSFTRSACVALAFGIAFHFVLTELYRYTGYVLQFTFEVASALGLDEAATRLFVRVIAAAIRAIIVGLLFGVPFGLLVRKRIVRYWLLAVAAAVATQFTVLVIAGLNIEWLLVEWTLPDVWLNLLATLGIAVVTARLWYQRAIPEPNAP